MPRLIIRCMKNYHISSNSNKKEKGHKSLKKLEEEETLKMLRRELVPKAQPIPYFERPFIPKRKIGKLTDGGATTPTGLITTPSRGHVNLAVTFGNFSFCSFVRCRGM